ncbi:EAL domain-containing protein [Aliiglaciecola sp. M165]|uniref:bifunctional diguanylate cyclase/phosphodiesterase n=1 Tax=Aliiglaciecola sp. M165 TaxID=2593649 RepID=UPI00117D7F40|nr:EAL domain-containing protein [Aliiglaciecola sp. M165]TRY32844.1 EAL domain-containing protein [Aliiglaciecola sp. M165]
MPLSRQLGLSLFFVLLVVFIGVLWLNVSSTRDYTQQQLASHAQDTATSLGLSITPYIGNNEDLPIIETMVNAIFDRGYYLTISLVNNEGKVLLEKHNPSKPQNIPQWFIDIFPLEPPKSTTEINSGWTIAGVLEVTSHPGFGYQQLWQNALRALTIISAVFFIALLGVLLAVRVITQPLLQVAQNAKSISERNFVTITDIPKTPELNVLVKAFNSMSSRLKRSFDSLTEQAERYGVYAYQDSLTGVGNRRSFLMTLEKYLADKENHPDGYLILIRLSSLGQVNSEFGASIADQYIKTTLQEIQQHVTQSDFSFDIFRINGADFVLLIEDMDAECCKTFTKQLSEGFEGQTKSEYQSGTAHIGVCHYLASDNIGEILERADSALASAQGNSSRWEIASNLDLIKSNSAWRAQLQDIVQKGDVDFVVQPLMNWQQNVVYQELFARFKDSDTQSHIPMGQLVPAAFRLNFVTQIDKLVITSALSRLVEFEHSIGINISRNSLRDIQFQNWLESELPKSPQQSGKIVLEIPERALVDEVSQISDFLHRLQQRGIRITVERFGAQIIGFRHLRAIKPNFLKIDGQFVRNIHKEPDNQLFVRSLIGIADGLNISVIAEMVESEEEAQFLHNLGITIVQGFHLAKPKAI